MAVAFRCPLSVFEPPFPSRSLALQDSLQLVDAASAAFERGDHADSLLLYQQAIRLRPNHQFLYLAAGRCLNKLGRSEEAAALLKQHLLLDPTSVPGLIGMAEIHRNQGRWGPALNFYQKAQQLKPNHPGVLQALSKAREELGPTDFEQLISQSTQSLVAQQKSTAPDNDLTEAHISARKYHTDLLSILDNRQISKDQLLQVASDLAVLLRQQPMEPLFLDLEAKLIQTINLGCGWAQFQSLEEFPQLSQSVQEPDGTYLDPLQKSEWAGQSDLEDLNLDWSSLKGQLQLAIGGIHVLGKKPLILDAGTSIGLSASWLARRWKQTRVIVMQQRTIDRLPISRHLAGSEVQGIVSRLTSQPTLITDASASYPLGWPLDQIDKILPMAVPLILHLNVNMEGFGDLFRPGANWVKTFPLILIRGGLIADSQGRMVSQPYHNVFAAEGFDLLRSGSLLVAFQNSRLSQLAAQATMLVTPPVHAHEASSPMSTVPPDGLKGEIQISQSVVAFDGEWQYPAITEQRAYQLVRRYYRPAIDHVYIGFPWASLIDNLNQGTRRGKALLECLELLLPHLQPFRRRVTVCQQIFFLQHRWIFERAGITDVFWPHTTIFDADPSLKLHPFPLFPVHWVAEEADSPRRDIDYSFIGARSSRLYLSNSRDLIIDTLQGLPGSWIEGNDHWFYRDLVYGHQISGRLTKDDQRITGAEVEAKRERYIESLRRSIFTICPSGTGPNTIRLWEAIGSGSIPIILSDRFRAPGPRELWDQAVFVLPDTAEGVLAIPQRAQQWAADAQLIAKKRAGLRRLWQRYGPETFITDILELE